MYVEITDDEQMDMLMIFLNEKGIKSCTFVEMMVKRVQKKLHITLQELTYRYLTIFRKYSALMPCFIKCVVKPDKLLVEVYDEQNKRLSLKENGQLQTYLSLARHHVKMYKEEMKTEGIGDFELKIKIFEKVI